MPDATPPMVRQLNYRNCTKKTPEMSVEKIIIDRIRQEGPISFRDFMEMALYHPGEGYYTSAGDKIGQSGDFLYQSLSYHAVRGPGRRPLIRRNVAAPGPAALYHCRAGEPAQDCFAVIFSTWLAANKELYDPLNYIIIEKSASMREKEKHLLSALPGDPDPPIDLPTKVSWADSINHIPPVTGCIFSNELIDNFSVHQVVMADELMEVLRRTTKMALSVPTASPPAQAALKEYIRESGARYRSRMVSGPRFCLEAVDWIQAISKKPAQGLCHATIDYGYSSSDLYNQSKKTGTLVCYHRHQVNDRPYEQVGRQDITNPMSILLPSITGAGSQRSRTKCGYTNQAFFLRGLGSRHPFTPAGRKERRPPRRARTTPSGPSSVNGNGK